MKHIAYLRDSADYQIEVEQLKLDPVEYDEIFIDTVNAKALKRPELEKCIAILNADTTLHVQSADRLAKNSIQLRRHINSILKTEALLHLHEEEIVLGFDDKTIPMLKMLNCIADLESRIFTETMLEGKAIKRKLKIKKSRHTYSEEEMMSFYKRYKDGEPAKEIVKDLTITTSTLYRIFAKTEKMMWGITGKPEDTPLPPK